MKKGLKLKGGMPNSFGIRDCNIDIIRLIACAAVVGLHTFPKDLSLVTASLYYLSGFAVPFFFMSSGFFLLNRGELNYKYVWHKCAGIIKIVLFWNCILYALRLGKALIFNKHFCISGRILKVFRTKGKAVAILVPWCAINYLCVSSSSIQIESKI